MREFVNIHEAFAYATECQLATVEGLESLKRPSKSELSRHKNIADIMVRACFMHGVTDQVIFNVFAGRLRDKLLRESEREWSVKRKPVEAPRRAALEAGGCEWPFCREFGSCDYQGYCLRHWEFISSDIKEKD